jgi:hypothetical protein
MVRLNVTAPAKPAMSATSTKNKLIADARCASVAACTEALALSAAIS